MESIYRQLQRKINTIGVGMPESMKGYDEQYLKVLFTPEEAEFAMNMPRGFRTLEEVAEAVEKPVDETKKMLDIMAKDGLVYHALDKEGVRRYYLCATYHGFFEWNLGRMDPSWVKPMVKHNMEGLTHVFFNTQYPIFRYLPIRPELVEDGKCLDMDNMEKVIRSHKKISVQPCFCRMTANTYAGKDICKHCDPPGNYEVCLGFDDFTDFYVNVLGVGRYITADEAIEIMHRASKNGTLCMVFNDRNSEAMCSCCACCCGVVGGLRAFGPGKAKGHLSNYVSVFDESKCVKCYECTKRCPTKARKGIKDEEGNIIGIKFDPDKCLGCGLCVDTCKGKALKLVRQPDDQIYEPPVDTYTELMDIISEDRRSTNMI